jgi:hypothetical protein
MDSSRGFGNNVGNAYVFTPDLLASMLEVLPAHAFKPHLSKIEEHVRCGPLLHTSPPHL